MAKKKPKRRPANHVGPNRRRAANETRLAQRARAHAEARSDIDMSEFEEMYARALELAEAADQDPKPERYQALLGYYEVIADWMHKHDRSVEGKYAQRIEELNKNLIQRVDDRLTFLRALRPEDLTPEMKEEFEGWRRIWNRLHPDRTVPEMLADDGLELHQGKNEEGEDILWVEPEGGAVDDTDPLYRGAKKYGVELTKRQLELLREGRTLDEVIGPQKAESIRQQAAEQGADVEGFQERMNRLERIAELVDRDPENTHHFLSELDDFAHWLASDDGGGIDPITAAQILKPFREKAMEVSPYENAAVELLPPRADGVHKTGWHEVVDLQDEMIRFWASPFGREYGRAWGKSMVQSASENNAQHPSEEWTPERMSWALQLARIEQAKLQMADPVYINEEVQQLIAATVDSWPPTPLRPEDIFPSPFGFAVFPQPFTILDHYGRRVAFRAFAWELLGPQGQIMFEAGAAQIDPREATGVFISAYAHRNDPDDYPIMQNMEAAAKEGKLKVPLTVLPVMSLSYATPWHFEQGYYDGRHEHNPLPVDLTGSGLERFCAIVRVTWAMAQEKITSAPLERLPRPERRRAERTGLIPDVVVIRLRHASSKKKEDGEPSSIEYSHRWAVRPHWRNQYYPSENRHKPKLIGMYIKGPEDKPFVAKPLRAYEFTR